MQFVGRAGEKLRRQRLMAGQVLVFVTTNRFSATQSFYGLCQLSHHKGEFGCVIGDGSFTPPLPAPSSGQTVLDGCPGAAPA